MSSKKSSSLFLILLLVSSVVVLGNSRTVSALTPVADLTGQWSGFAQITNTEGTCEFTGKVNAQFTQNGNDIKGKYSFVQTGAKSSNPDIYYCDIGSFGQDIHGTLDGSRITLYSEDSTFSGWYASSGIKLDITSDGITGKAQLSPVNFTPPSFTPKSDDAAKKKAADDLAKKKAADDLAKKKADQTKKTEEKTPPTETKSKVIEPPSPSVFEINEKTKPFFKALWDGKCDVLSHQWELLTTKSGRLPIVCTGGSVALPSGEIIQFSVGDNVGIELVKWGAKGLFAKYVYAAIAVKEVRDLIRLSRDAAKITDDVTGAKSAYDRIESIKTLNLLISKGEGELLGGVIKFKISCPTGECKFIKMEEEGGGFKLYDVPSTYDSTTKTLEALVNHHSVYLLVEYTPEKTQEKKSDQTTPAPTPKATKYLSYENKPYGFSIKYPSDWKKTQLLKKDNTFPDLLNIMSLSSPSGEANANVGFIQDDANKGISQKMLSMIKNEARDQFETGFCSAASAGVTCSVDVYENSTTSAKNYAVHVIALLATMSSAQGSFTLPAVLVGVIPNGNDAWIIILGNLSVNATEQNSKALDEIAQSFTIFKYKGESKTSKQSLAVAESSAGTLTLNSNEFTVSKYSPAEAIVSGHVNSYQRGVVLTIKIVKPDGSSAEQGIVVTKDGNFKAPLKIDSNWPAGNYQLLASYGSQDLGSISFSIKKS